MFGGGHNLVLSLGLGVGNACTHGLKRGCPKKEGKINNKNNKTRQFTNTGRNKTRNQRPETGIKVGTKFCQPNIAIKHACIELKFGPNVDYRLFFEMHIRICFHLPYCYYMQVEYRTISWNTDPGPTFSVLTMSRDLNFRQQRN